MPVAKFRKKPVVIEAIKFEGLENFGEVQDFTGADQFRYVDPEDRDDDFDIFAEVWDRLHSTWVGVKISQWIIKGVQGEFYPCDKDVFESTYEVVDAS